MPNSSFFFKKNIFTQMKFFCRIVASITGITVCARYLVTSIEHLAHSFHLGNGFIGMVLLPLCGMFKILF